MLEDQPPEQRVSTGFDALDSALGGLYWGDNVVWDVESVSADPFYSAIARRAHEFDSASFISVGGSPIALGAPDMTVIRAGPGSALEHAGDLLREIYRISHPGGRRLLLFESLESMVGAWGAKATRGFFARCCPLLLDVGAIAYWSMSARATPLTVRETVESVTQVILRVDERSIRVTKAEARGEGVRGSVLHWHTEDGRPVMDLADVIARVAASLRAIRRSRQLSQTELAQAAGVTASAISQAERAERGLSLATLARLSSALGITIDDLIRGADPEIYRIGRRTDDRLGGSEHTITLLGDSRVQIDLVRLGPLEASGPTDQHEGLGIVAVATGLIQVQIAGGNPGVRAGEVLVAEGDRVEGWRNLAQAEAVLFWIVVRPEGSVWTNRRT
jgi:transcriptional regulator with XRE-family HTH domain